MPYLDYSGLQRFKEKLDAAFMDKPTNVGTANQVLRNNGSGGSEWVNNPSEDTSDAGVAYHLKFYLDSDGDLCQVD